MARPRDLIGVVLVVGAIIVGIAAKPGAVRAGGECRASFVILGQTPALTGATPTNWFNVFGENFDPSAAAILTFSVPVIPWSVEQLGSQPAVTTFTMPAEWMGSDFKMTFRAPDGKVQKIHVRITGKACNASTVVDFSPPVTSTVQDAPSVRDQSRVSLLVPLVAFGGGALALRRRLRSEQ